MWGFREKEILNAKKAINNSSTPVQIKTNKLYHSHKIY